MITTQKPAEKIQPHDVIVFLGELHVVTDIEPYTHPTLGPTCGIAKAADGWSMTLFPSTTVEVTGTAHPTYVSEVKGGKHQAECRSCGEVGVPQRYSVDADAIAQRHAEVGGFG